MPLESVSKDGFNYGETWNSWDKNLRINWVWGFTLGQELIFEELEIKEKEKYKYYVSSFDADVISDIMTQYYSDAANTHIPWKYIAYAAKMKLKGKSHEQIEKELESFRGYADWLRKSK
ncbi:MAG: hypothetical protein AB1306_09035 [Nitrospirota bacterium]